MSNYRRLISYIYAYEGGVKGKNIGYAKIEVRGEQCRVYVNVRKVYIGGNDIGVYLLTPGAEIKVGKIFIRGGNGEFRTNINAENIEGSGYSVGECYGLTVHDVEGVWQSYTTIWEDAVAHAAEIELADVTAENVRKKEELAGKAPKLSNGRQTEPEAQDTGQQVQPLLGTGTQGQGREPQGQGQEPQGQGQEPQGQGREPQGQGQEPQDQNQEPQGQGQEPQGQGQEPQGQGREPQGQGREPQGQGIRSHETREEDIQDRKAGDQEIQDLKVQDRKTPRPGVQDGGILRPDNQEQVQEAVRKPKLPISEEIEREFAREEEKLKDMVPWEEEPRERKEIPPQTPFPQLQDPERLAALDRQDEAALHADNRIWNQMQRRYAKVSAFDYENGCEILSIKPQDIGLLPREIWVYGNNSFLLHGYYNYRHLILARLENPQGEPRYLLGVPGHYFSNERNMAAMFGFPHFVLAKKQPNEDGRFGYWYANIRL